MDSSSHWIWWSVAICVTSFLLDICAAFEKVKCKKDQDLGEYAINIYYCEDEAKPMCCEVGEAYTCCVTDVEKNGTEQAQLWGLLGLVVVIGAFIVVCWRKDTYLCEGDNMKDRCGKCCCCCKPKQPEKEPELSDLGGNHTMGHQSGGGGAGMTAYGNGGAAAWNGKPRGVHGFNNNHNDDIPVTARHVNPMMASTFDPYNPDCQVHKTQDLYGSDIGEDFRGGGGGRDMGEEDSGRGSAISLEEFKDKGAVGGAYMGGASNRNGKRQTADSKC